ncbi:MAG: glycosyltransferase family 9 protein, partial [Polyangiaceae bacterium]
GAPVVALYGPKDPRVYAPWSAARGGPAPTIWTGAPCSPCTLRRCGNPICMDSITPRAVARAVEEILNERSVSSSRAR